MAWFLTDSKIWATASVVDGKFRAESFCVESSFKLRYGSMQFLAVDGLQQDARMAMPVYSNGPAHAGSFEGGMIVWVILAYAAIRR